MLRPHLIVGDSFKDFRGEIRFVNDFCFKEIKRFYHIFQNDTSIIRAWQGHQFESKFFYVTSGSFIIAWVQIDDWISPSNDLKAEIIKLEANKPSIFFLPGGYANGIKAIEPNSSLIIFSDKSLNESTEDRFSFSNDNWLNWESLKTE